MERKKRTEAEGKGKGRIGKVDDKPERKGKKNPNRRKGKEEKEKNI